jgi:hypothetical protein
MGIFTAPLHLLHTTFKSSSITPITLLSSIMQIMNNPALIMCAQLRHRPTHGPCIHSTGHIYICPIHSSLLLSSILETNTILNFYQYD